MHHDRLAPDDEGDAAGGCGIRGVRDRRTAGRVRRPRADGRLGRGRPSTPTGAYARASARAYSRVNSHTCICALHSNIRRGRAFASRDYKGRHIRNAGYGVAPRCGPLATANAHLMQSTKCALTCVSTACAAPAWRTKIASHSLMHPAARQPCRPIRKFADFPIRGDTPGKSQYHHS